LAFGKDILDYRLSVENPDGGPAVGAACRVPHKPLGARCLGFVHVEMVEGNVDFNLQLKGFSFVIPTRSVPYIHGF